MVIVAPLLKVRDRVFAVIGRRATVTSTGRATTERGDRYGRQLTSHLGRRAEGSAWDESTRSGYVEFDGVSRLDMTAEPDGLSFVLRCPVGRVDELRDVVGRHLERFGARDGLRVIWNGPTGRKH